MKKIANAAARRKIDPATAATTGTVTVFFFLLLHEIEEQRPGFPPTLD